VNRRHVLASIIVCVWLGACEKSDDGTRIRSDFGACAEAGLSDGYSLIHGLGVDSSLPGNSEFGTCVDDPQFLTGCEAPVAEPASPAPSKIDVSETICTVTHYSSGSVGIEHPAAAQITIVVPPDQPEPLLAASTLIKRCGSEDSSMEPGPTTDARTTEQAVGCSCGMKVCACG